MQGSKREVIASPIEVNSGPRPPFGEPSVPHSAADGLPPIRGPLPQWAKQKKSSALRNSFFSNVLPTGVVLSRALLWQKTITCAQIERPIILCQFRFLNNFKLFKSRVDRATCYNYPIMTILQRGQASRQGFTIIELLIVIAILAVLMIAVIVAINPAELLNQSRDSTRFSNLSSIKSALDLYTADVTPQHLGSSSVFYLSIPDPNATTTAGTDCSSLGFPAGGSYHCAASSTYRLPNSLGWIPVDLTKISGGSPLPTLPVDPINSSASGLYYAYVTNGTTWEICASSQSQKYGSQTPQIMIGTGVILTGCSSLSSTSSYNQVVLADSPVAFWNLDPKNSNEIDVSGNGNMGTYENGLPATTTMPNDDIAADFNGSSQYLTIPSNHSFSIPTTNDLTWEAWIHPDTLQFPYGSNSDYVDFMGKCAIYNPSCEWEGRMYDTTTEQAGRSNRISAYVFNPTAGLGSGADWQPTSTLIQAGQWIYVVGEYTTKTQPSDCPNSSAYPGSINIWVDGVEWNQTYHGSTGCMSQYNIAPQAGNSPLNIGTMALDTWFKGAIGKVAIYNYLLSQTQINNHYRLMTGLTPTGSCGITCTFSSLQ